MAFATVPSGHIRYIFRVRLSARCPEWTIHWSWGGPSIGTGGPLVRYGHAGMDSLWCISNRRSPTNQHSASPTRTDVCGTSRPALATRRMRRLCSDNSQRPNIGPIVRARMTQIHWGSVLSKITCAGWLAPPGHLQKLASVSGAAPQPRNVLILIHGRRNPRQEAGP